MKPQNIVKHDGEKKKSRKSVNLGGDDNNNDGSEWKSLSETTSQETKINNSCENTSTNALTQGKKIKKSFSCPVKYVIYPQKNSTTKLGVPSQAAKSILGHNNRYKFSDEGSPTRSKAPEVNSTPDRAVHSLSSKAHETTMTSKAESGNATMSQSAPITTKSTSNEEAGIFDAVYTIVTAPGLLIGKAIGMLSPFSKRASTSNNRAGTTNEENTPGSQKKVVFNLRRNSSNKFKDYLTSMAKEPSPAYEPGKSPGQSILKSPSTSSLNSIDSNSLDSATTTSKCRRKRGSKSPRARVRKR